MGESGIRSSSILSSNGWCLLRQIAINFVYVWFFLPETKGVPLEGMAVMWASHRFWKRVIMTSEERAAFERGDLVAAGLATPEVASPSPSVACFVAI